MLEVTHTEFAKASPQSVWKFWSHVETWSVWDKGVEWCKLEDNGIFKVGAKASLMPKAAPNPVSIEITECEENRSFTDIAKMDLGLLKLIHSLEVEKDGVKITHTMQIFPHNEATKAIFEQHIFPKMQKELPESVKTLAALAEKVCLET